MNSQTHKPTRVPAQQVRYLAEWIETQSDDDPANCNYVGAAFKSHDEAEAYATGQAAIGPCPDWSSVTEEHWSREFNPDGEWLPVARWIDGSEVPA